MFDKKVNVWINGGNSSFFMKVKKGTRVFLSGGSSYVIGSSNNKIKTHSIEEKKFMLEIYGYFTSYHQFKKLDLTTKYELLRNGIKITDSIPFHLDCTYTDNNAHVYDSYEQYEKVIKYYVPNISEEALNKGIYVINKNGQIISLDKTCYEIIFNARSLEKKQPVKILVPNNKK